MVRELHRTVIVLPDGSEVITYTLAAAPQWTFAASSGPARVKRHANGETPSEVST